MKNSTGNLNTFDTENISGNMHCLREAISHYLKSTPSVVSKKDWNTKEDKSKSMMHALYVLQLAKRHISGQSDVEQ